MADHKTVQENFGWLTKVRIEFGHFQRSKNFGPRFISLISIQTIIYKCSCLKQSLLEPSALFTSLSARLAFVPERILRGLYRAQLTWHFQVVPCWKPAPWWRPVLKTRPLMHLRKKMWKTYVWKPNFFPFLSCINGTYKANKNPIFTYGNNQAEIGWMSSWHWVDLNNTPNRRIRFILDIWW